MNEYEFFKIFFKILMMLTKQNTDLGLIVIFWKLGAVLFSRLSSGAAGGRGLSDDHCTDGNQADTARMFSCIPDDFRGLFLAKIGEHRCFKL